MSVLVQMMIIMSEGETLANIIVPLFPQCFFYKKKKKNLSVSRQFISNGESNTIVSAYTMYRHLQ